MTEFLFNGPETAALTLVLAHGAGGPMDSPFMETIAGGAAKAGIRVARFEFPYMRRRRETGKGGAPDSGPALMQSWRDTIAKLGGAKRLVIGGKSLGGRIASMIADETGVRGLVCLGYPFHPPGKPERTRTRHLEHLRTPALVLQGTRDTFGSPRISAPTNSHPRSVSHGSRMATIPSSLARARAGRRPTISTRRSPGSRNLSSRFKFVRRF